MSEKQRVVALTETENGNVVVLGVYGPYEDVMAASDALELLRGVRVPMGRKLHLRQTVVEDPAALVQRLQEFAAH